MTTILQEWLDFRDKVIASDAPDIQVREMKKAFYGGAISTFAQVALANTPEELDALHAELRQFQFEELERITTKKRSVH